MCLKYSLHERIKSKDIFRHIYHPLRNHFVTIPVVINPIISCENLVCTRIVQKPCTNHVAWSMIDGKTETIYPRPDNLYLLSYLSILICVWASRSNSITSTLYKSQLFQSCPAFSWKWSDQTIAVSNRRFSIYKVGLHCPCAFLFTGNAVPTNHVVANTLSVYSILPNGN